MAPPSFVAPLTALPRAVKQRPGLCPVRASAATPPNPGPPDDPPATPEDSARAALEKSFGRDIDAESGSGGGKCDCIWCQGTGKRTCAWCKGEGSRKEYMHKSWTEMTIEVEKAIENDEPVKLPEQIPTQCSACGGSCVMRCAKCRGSGVGSYGMGFKK